MRVGIMPYGKSITYFDVEAQELGQTLRIALKKAELQGITISDTPMIVLNGKAADYQFHSRQVLSEDDWVEILENPPN